MSATLPISEIVEEVRGALVRNTTLILQAPPGAGKSTWLPLQLMEESWLKGQKILMLEPRRLAARAVATRMAQSLNEPVGGRIGYRVRFDTKVSAKTQIEVLTEGILTRMMQKDQELEGVGMVILDEFHERSLHADLSLVLARQLQQVLREDLRILIMSATLDTAGIAAKMGNAPILTSKGRQFPVEFRYKEPRPGVHISQEVAALVPVILAKEEGDVLVFLPGAGEIRRCAELLTEAGIPAEVHLLYGNLSPEVQDAALRPDPAGRRKVVLATSIAETSLTIEGIRIVVDAGLSREPRFDPRSGLTRLETVSVTQDAAGQRAGRAGRLGPGICYRLWAEGKQAYLQAHRRPEIYAADLASLALELANWGVNQLDELDWPDVPPAGAWTQARDLLYGLGAIEQGRITDRGREILALPTHPRIAHLLLEGKKQGLASLGSDLAAILEERSPLEREQGADVSLIVDALRSWRKREGVAARVQVLRRIERLAASWRRRLHCEAEISLADQYALGKLLAAAYPDRIARRVGAQSEAYRLANGRRAKLPPRDALAREEWLAVAHVDAGQQEGKIFLAAPLHPDDLRHLSTETEVIRWNPEKGRIEAGKEVRIAALPLSFEETSRISDEKALPHLLQAIRENPRLLNQDEETQALMARVQSLHHWRAEEGWPDFTWETLLEGLPGWLAPYLNGVRKKEQLQKLKLSGILKNSLPWPLPQQLDLLAPTHIEVPSGSNIRLQYQMDASPPVLAVRVQEVYSLLDTPTVNEGRTRVLLHLLSPAMRPVQITQDLAGFWQNSYPDVKKDMKGRYPKHFWPDDPANSPATRKTKKHM